MVVISTGSEGEREAHSRVGEGGRGSLKILNLKGRNNTSHNRHSGRKS